ncbi:MAG: replicative DNA helicase, partial [Oscillospiraceae bacterium]|nr:replicative DNA helicase [Oscillospiraceae bacterium]
MMEFDEIAGREMPHSVEAEQTVLGAVLLDSDLLAQVMNYVKPESFYISKHRQLFAIILRLFTLG